LKNKRGKEIWAKNGAVRRFDIAIAMTRFFNEVDGKKKPSSKVKINLSDYLRSVYTKKAVYT